MTYVDGHSDGWKYYQACNPHDVFILFTSCKNAVFGTTVMGSLAAPELTCVHNRAEL
jgi:hypothetical protein